MSSLPVIPGPEIDLQVIRKKNGRLRGYRCATKDLTWAKFFEDFPLKLCIGSIGIFLSPRHFILEEDRDPFPPRKIRIPFKSQETRRGIYRFYESDRSFKVQSIEDDQLVGFEVLR